MESEGPATEDPRAGGPGLPAGLDLPVYAAEGQQCPYLPGRRWEKDIVPAWLASPGSREALLGQGWRRAGPVLYRNRCPDCTLCIPIRVPAGGLEQGRSQRRIARKNADISVEISDAAFDPARYRLYSRYVAARHGGSVDAAGYAGFLLDPAALPGTPSAGARVLVTDYREKNGGNLVATGYLDLLPAGLSSIYFAFDPTGAGRSLGTFSVAAESAIARDMGLSWYYLGFWVPGSPRMDYKAGFRPFELLLPTGGGRACWTPFRDRREASDRIASTGCR